MVVLVDHYQTGHKVGLAAGLTRADAQLCCCISVSKSIFHELCCVFDVAIHFQAEGWL
jgi:hypothetical protein